MKYFICYTQFCPPLGGLSEYWKKHLEKNVEELRASRERCFEKSLDCMEKIKASFAKVGAYSTEENFI
jgi:hypothetical protein